MPKKLNSYILPDKLIKNMKNKIEEARIQDVEVGFNLCAEDNILHDEFPCSGTECEIRFTNKCLKGKNVGIFHTHQESLEPSIVDILQAYDLGINCIGSVEQKKIRCHMRKDQHLNPEDYKIIEYNITRFEDPLMKDAPTDVDIRRYKKWIGVRNSLKKQYLNTVDII